MEVGPARGSRPAAGRRSLAVCAGAVAVLAGCRGEVARKVAPPPRAVEVVTLAPTELRDVGEYLGSLWSRDSVTVRSDVAGYVRAIHVRPGQRVEAGAPLVEVDAREESAALASASAQAASARAALELARRLSSRAEALVREGLVSAQELEQRQADVTSAEAALTAAEAQVAQRQVVVGNHVLRAKVPGVIAEVEVRVGDYVTATAPLTAIAQAGALELTLAVPAERARGLAVGAPIEVLGPGGEVAVATTAFYVAPEVDPRTQLVEVKAILADPHGLRSRELVRARLIYATSRALIVPALAVVRQGGQGFVFAIVDKDGGLVVERRPVVLGALGERGYRVVSGLVAGDRIAASSIQMLRDGSPVTLETKAPATEPAAGP